MINSNDHDGPLVTIIHTESMPQTIRDNEHYQQRLILNCGHWCYNTFGNIRPKFHEGQQIKCLKCHEKGK